MLLISAYTFFKDSDRELILRSDNTINILKMVATKEIAQKYRIEDKIAEWSNCLPILVENCKFVIYETETDTSTNVLSLVDFI